MAGHQNHHQKIHYMERLKQANIELTEVCSTDDTFAVDVGEMNPDVGPRKLQDRIKYFETLKQQFDLDASTLNESRRSSKRSSVGSLDLDVERSSKEEKSRIRAEIDPRRSADAFHSVCNYGRVISTKSVNLDEESFEAGDVRGEVPRRDQTLKSDRDESGTQKAATNPRASGMSYMQSPPVGFKEVGSPADLVNTGITHACSKSLSQESDLKKEKQREGGNYSSGWMSPSDQEINTSKYSVTAPTSVDSLSNSKNIYISPSSSVVSFAKASTKIAGLADKEDLTPENDVAPDIAAGWSPFILVQDKTKKGIVIGKKKALFERSFSRDNMCRHVEEHTEFRRGADISGRHDDPVTCRQTTKPFQGSKANTKSLSPKHCRLFSSKPTSFKSRNVHDETHGTQEAQQDPSRPCRASYPQVMRSEQSRGTVGKIQMNFQYLHQK